MFIRYYDISNTNTYINERILQVHIIMNVTNK